MHQLLLGIKHASITMAKQTCINWFWETNMHQLPWGTNMHHYYGETNMQQLLWGNKHESITMGKQKCINYYEETNTSILYSSNVFSLFLIVRIKI